jgi:tetratricopeptide (TPR) repeat protein
MRAPGVVAQAAPEDHEVARAHFVAGSAHYDRGAYEDAIREFETAYGIAPLPEILYNLYRAHEALGHTEDAVRYLERYLPDAREVEERSVLEERLANLRARLEEERRAHDADAQAAREAEERRVREAEERAARRGAEEEAARRAEISASRGSGGPTDFTTPAIASFVGGGVGLAAFGVLAILAAVENDRLASECGDAVGSYCVEDDLGTLHAYALVADIGLGVGVLGAALGTVFLLLDGGGDGETAQAVLRVGPLSLALGGRF